MKIRHKYLGAIGRRFLPHSILVAAALFATPLQAAPVNAPVAGEIQFITLDNPADHWSGGTIVVGGQVVILPRNLLLDLPANRVTLQELFAQAPAACVAVGESGLAKGDSCNVTGMGGIASIAANRTNAGNVIAGDVLIEKGAEAVTGTVSYIDYNDGYFRLNGIPGDPATGVMVRLNDPDGRHTVQQGLGCAAGSPNCSPDPRFTLDGDNYTNVYSNGYPLCLPSTVTRNFADVLGLGTTVAQASADGSGDALCPMSNRTVQPVADSRRFAPLLLGDSITVEGNFERVNGVQFLSAHSSMIAAAMQTSNAPGQPDYLFLDEVEIDAPGFQNQRARTLIIGYSTLAPSDIKIWSIHYDPVTNAPHEFPLASSVGCDLAAGPGTCGQQGLVGTGNAIFKIRHDIDFLVGAKPRLDPCAHLRADPLFGSLNICPNSPVRGELNTAEMFGILSPIPHEIQARTGHSLANPGLITLDINGNEATNGQYLFPFGMNLGGISTPEFNEINLDALNTPFNFTGLPWTLDRRLSPAGCFGPCEATPQPLDPYPFEGVPMDPRFQATLPTGPYADANYSATTLADVRNRIFAFVDPALSRLNGNGFDSPAAGNFSGLAANRVAWPPVDPAALPIVVTPLVSLLPNTLPEAVADTAITTQGVAITIPVLANDSDADGNPLTITVVTQGSGGAVTNNGSNVTYAPGLLFTGVDSFSYTISDGQGGTATAPVSVTVNQAQNTPPVANADSASTAFGIAATINVLANDSDANGDPLGVVAVTNGSKGTVVNNGISVTYTPNAGASGSDLFTYTVADGRGGSATGTVTVTIGPAPTITLTLADFIANGAEWRIAGTNSTAGATVTVRRGVDLSGPVIGTAVVSATRTWTLRVRNSAILPDASNTISVRSTDGATLLAQPIRLR